jgi:transaldolase / glucose-6-phosphate isomerase
MAVKVRKDAIMSRLKELQQHGQSVWLDYIKRSLLSTGELERLIVHDSIRGLTSNPSIFEKAIAETTEYSSDIRKLGNQYSSSKDIYEQLAIADIRSAADTLRPVYDATHRRDGYVSLEVSPELSHDTAGTIAEARRLWNAVGRDNLMIKVPGTLEGIPACEALISEGINVNVTLLFSVDLYTRVAQAYMAGLSWFASQGGELNRVASVASFFVSRVDSAVDALLLERIATAPASEKAALESLLGKAAVANAKLAYEQYNTLFKGPKWETLEAAGAQTQRLLWASTGTKNPKYRDVVYVEELIGADTVNTMPPATLDAFRAHGTARSTLAEGIDTAHATVAALEQAGISIGAVAQKLLDEGQKLFVDAFRKLLAAVDKARTASEQSGRTSPAGRGSR